MNKSVINQYMKYVPIVLCLITILALLFTFASATIEANVSSDSEYIEDSSSQTEMRVSGFTAAFASFFGWLLIVAPAAYIGSYFVDQLKPYQKIFTIGIPLVTMIVLFLTIGEVNLFASIGDSTTVMEGATASVETNVSGGFGYYLMLISQILLLAHGVYTLFFGEKTEKTDATV